VQVRLVVSNFLYSLLCLSSLGSLGQSVTVTIPQSWGYNFQCWAMGHWQGRGWCPFFHASIDKPWHSRFRALCAICSIYRCAIYTDGYIGVHQVVCVYMRARCCCASLQEHSFRARIFRRTARDLNGPLLFICRLKNVKMTFINRKKCPKETWYKMLMGHFYTYIQKRRM